MTSAGAGHRRSLKGPALLAGFVLLFLAWTSVLLPGFAFPWVNNLFHLPIVLDYAGSAEGPHDAFTRSLDNFVSGFWLLFRPFTNEGNAFSVFFVAHLIGRLGFVAGIFALTRTLGADRVAAFALAGLACIAPIFKGVSTVGHTETLATYLSHTGFAIAMLPLCWWLLLRGRWIAGACALGLLFNVNAFISVWSVMAALAAFWAARGSVPDIWRRLALCALGYVLCALPTAIWTLSIVGEQAHPVAFGPYLRYYYPFHTFVHVQWDAVAQYGAFLAAASVAVWTAARDLGPKGRVLAAITAAYAAVFLIGIPLPYVTDARLLLNLYPLRIDALVNVGVAAMTLGWAGRSMAERRDSLPLAIALTLLMGNMIAALWLLFIHARRTSRGLVPLAIGAGASAVLAAMGLPPHLGEAFLPLLVIFSAAALCAAAASGPSATVPAALAMAVSMASVPGMLSPWAAAAIVVLGGVLAFPVPALVRRSAAAACSPPVLLGGVVVIGLGLTAFAAWRGSVERPDVDLAPDREAQLWLRRHTAPGTQFLPIGVNGFGLLSRRPAWVDAQSGAAVMWKPSFHDEWWPRIQALNACKTEACQVDLARRNGVRWIVAHGNSFVNVPGLSVQFTNSRYQILRIDHAPEGRHRQ